MSRAPVELDSLLTGCHATRVSGDAALAETVRTMEGAHTRTFKKPEPTIEFRHVALGVIRIGLRSHRATQRVAADRSPTGDYLVQFVFGATVSVIIDREHLRIGPGDAVLIPPGCRFQREEDHDQGATISVSFDGLAVRSRLAARLRRALDRPLAFEARVGSSRDALLAMVISIDRALESGLASPHDPAIEAMERAFIDLLLDLQPHSYSGDLSATEDERRSRRIELVRDLVDRDPSARHAVEDLAAAAGCTVRSLQTSFAECSSTNPMDFVRGRRLQLARARLLDVDCHQPIWSVAKDHGFANASRFAVEYRRAYGETPSETRQRRPGRAG